MTNIVTLFGVSGRKGKPQERGQKAPQRLDKIIAVPCINIEVIACETCE